MMSMMCGMGAMFIGGLILLALIIVGAVLLLKPRGEHGRALQILDERLARGEIDQNDYQERRDLLLRDSERLNVLNRS